VPFFARLAGGVAGEGDGLRRVSLLISMAAELGKRLLAEVQEVGLDEVSWMVPCVT